MESNLTAVEWLIDKILQTNHLKAIFEDEIIQAKEMEKQQIIDAYINGGHQHRFKAEAEQYYNETFNK
jgi:hypothetical protein